MSRIRQIDAYIAEAPEFARPILERIRDAFHAATPRMEEAMKWSTPHFVQDRIVGGMAAFKQHVRLAFWRGTELKDPAGLFEPTGNTQMAALKIHSLAELPPEKVLVAYVQEALALQATEKASPAKKRTRKSARPAPRTPPDLLAALRKTPKAKTTFEAFPPSHKREYIEWLEEAKRPETRTKRLGQAIEWMSEGKPRNWKYMAR